MWPKADIFFFFKERQPSAHVGTVLKPATDVAEGRHKFFTVNVGLRPTFGTVLKPATDVAEG